MPDMPAIQAYCDALAARFKPAKIILFGSHVRGASSADSDVDLLIIQDRKRIGGERASVRIRQEIPRDFPLDVLVRTPAEIARRIRDGDPFLQGVLADGKVMYEARHA